MGSGKLFLSLAIVAVILAEGWAKEQSPEGKRAFSKFRIGFAVKEGIATPEEKMALLIMLAEDNEEPGPQLRVHLYEDDPDPRQQCGNAPNPFCESGKAGVDCTACGKDLHMPDGKPTPQLPGVLFVALAS
eukprot:3444126-Rhodomonas_salina.1